jgi:acetyl esterase/lipase
MKNRLNTQLTALVSCLGVTAVLLVAIGCNGSTSIVSAPASWPVSETISYSTSSSGALATDVYLPATAATQLRPAVLAIHGGAWLSGDKSDMSELAGFLCKLGYVVFSPNYRLSNVAVWPAQVDDCRTALAEVTANAAKWSVDPTRIGVAGISAGGNLALQLCFRDGPDGQRVKVAVDISAPTDFTWIDNNDYAAQVGGVIGHSAPWSRAELRELSPVFFARTDSRVLIIHGVGDENVYIRNADELARDLGEVGADFVYDRVGGALGDQHGTLWSAPDPSAKLAAFLASQL